MTATPELNRWDDALIAARLMAVDPAGLGGAVLRAAPGPARDLWVAWLRGLLGPGVPVRPVPAGIADDRLMGGVDLTATLRAGRPVAQRGVLAEADGGLILLAMAERIPADRAARVAAALDLGAVTIEREGITRRLPARFGVVAFDEGIEAEEQAPAALRERLAFHLVLDPISARGLANPVPDPAAIAAARRRLATVAPADTAIVTALVAVAAAYGIGSARAPILALRAARAAAALGGRDTIIREDAVLAARLVLAPRAVTAPAAPEESPEETPTEDTAEPPPDAPPEPGAADAGDADAGDQEPQPDPGDLAEILLAAVKSAVPEGLLAAMAGAGAAARQHPTQRDGGGAARLNDRRGRPAGVRMGPMRPGSRLALIDTLRAAAPWQVVRRREAVSGQAAPVAVRREDFRIKRFAQRREAAVVFSVDASGSAAFARLAEAKGAVEILLAEAYVARTYVALVVFRGTEAAVVLPPTRSLSRARALLADLPGGGGTPLAAGIEAAAEVAMAERARGRQPMLVMLTDARANIARDGTASRPRAAAEALAAARLVAARRMDAVLIDTAPRPRGEAAALAEAMGARYVALPYVEAGAVRDAVMGARAS